MECHPCYQWLLKVVTPYIERYPEVDIDVKQQFQFGGMKALLNYDIDVLVTPDPVHQPGVTFRSVLDYQQVLAVSTQHVLAKKIQIPRLSEWNTRRPATLKLAWIGVPHI